MSSRQKENNSEQRILRRRRTERTGASQPCGGRAMPSYHYLITLVQDKARHGKKTSTTMNSLLQKALGAAFALVLPLGASADWKTVYTDNFDDSDTYTANWIYGNSVYQIARSDSYGDGGNFICFWNSKKSGYDVTYSSPAGDEYASASSWKVTFDLAGAKNNSDGYNGYSYLLDDEGNKILIINQPAWSSGTIYDADSSTVIYALTYDSRQSSAPTSWAPGTWYSLTLTGDESADEVTLSIESAGATVLEATKVSSFLHFDSIYARMSGSYCALAFDNIKFYVYSDTEVVETPAADITKVDGTEREVTMECETDDVTIYYTEDGGDTQTYSDPVTVSETTTFAVWAVSASGTSSDTLSYTVEAGVEVSLADITYSVTGMTEVSGVYYPTYAFSIDNSDVLLTPEATLTATIDDSDVELTDDAYAAESTGTLVVTASADGYVSSTVSIDLNEYLLSQEPSVDYNEINSGNIEDVLGSDWSVSESSTRWSSWSLSNGVSADGTSNSGSSYYEASTSSTSVDYEFVTLENTGGVTLLIGYGFGSNARGNYISIVDSLVVDNAIAEYDRCGWGSSYDAVYVTTEESSNLQYTISKSSYTITSAKLYTPDTNVNVGISEVNTEVESGDAQSAPVYSLSGVMVRSAGEGVSGLAKGVYIMNGKKVMIK